VRLDVVTIFPDYLDPLRLSLIGRAVEDGLVDLRVHDLRSWTTDRHRTVDDTPYGGGPGMLMRPEPWGDALDSVCRHDAGPPPRILVPGPGGTPFSQSLGHELAAEPWLVFACGRYEGIDARVLEQAREHGRVDEVSLGDYVLNGGEVAVLAIVETVARLLPGVIGNADSLVEESHAVSSGGLLEAPGYTKPAAWRGREVPPVLLSGDHARIARWRRDESLRRTAASRPDLLERLDPAALDRADLALLETLGWAPAGSGRLARPEPPVAD